MLTGYEYLPATGAPEQELVLLHGWGSTRDIWRPLLRSLRPWANVTLLDIPGCAPGAGGVSGSGAPADSEDAYEDTLDCRHEGTFEEMLDALLARAPARAVYLGFSLGGQLALALAGRAPQRVAAVVTVCSNPRFVAGDGWPGIDREVLGGFRAALDDNPSSLLQRFGALQLVGEREPLGLRKLVRTLPRPALDPSLAAGLDWLAGLDLRAAVASLDVPQLHLQARADALVPPAVADALESLLPAGGQVVHLPCGCHLAPLACPDDIAREAGVFLAAAGLRGAGAHAQTQARIQVSKTAVAESFSRAAGRYDSVAGLQRDVGTHLLDSLDRVSTQPDVVLDLGCGTGFFAPELGRRFPAARYIGLDLAGGMVDYARRRCAGSGEWLVADAESLPLAPSSVDLVFSSLAIQWCYRPGHLFAELARVLRPGGVCVFTSLGPDTLRELRAAWAAVDAHQHVNAFLPVGDLASAADAVPGLRLDLDTRVFNMHYRRVRDLLDELKTLGAHNMNRDRPRGLTSRRALQGMLAAYEGWRRDGQLPATYEVIFGALEKT